MITMPTASDHGTPSGNRVKSSRTIGTGRNSRRPARRKCIDENGTLARGAFTDNGQTTTDRRQRTNDNGQTTTDRRQRTDDNGQTTTDWSGPHPIPLPLRG